MNLERRRIGGLILVLALAVLGRGGSPAGAARAIAGVPPFVAAVALGSVATATTPAPTERDAAPAITEVPGRVQPTAPLGTLDADLSIVKFDGPDPVDAGAALVYTLTVSNAGPEPAVLVSVSDSLPDGASFVEAVGDGWTCGFDSGSGTVTCTLALLSVGTANPISLTVHAPPDGGAIENTANVSSSLADPDSSNNSSTVTTTVSPLADLSLLKTDAPDPVAAGGTLTYTLSVSNAGPSDAASVSVADVLPGGAAFVDASGSGWTCGESSGTVTCTRDTLAPGAAPDIAIHVTAPAGGSLSNTASVSSATTDPDASNNSAGADTTVTPLADLSIAKTDAPDPVDAGGSLTYTLAVANAGPDAASSLSVTDTLPPAAAFVSATGTGWDCGEASGTVICTRAALASGAGAPDISIVVTTPTEGTTLSNSASVTAAEADPIPGNNTDGASTTVRVVADLSILKTDTPDPVDAGGALSYTLAVANAGPSTAASLSVIDTLPDGVGFVSASGSGWTCGQNAGTLTCTRATLATGPAPAITIEVTAPASAGPLSNTASVDAATFDPVPGNNSSTQETTVNALVLHADLSLVKSDAPDPVSAGGTLAYTVTVANAGPDPASSLSVTDTLPGGVDFVSATGTGWTCNQSSGTVTCTRATLASGATAPAITITVTAPAAATTLSNTASVSSATDDPLPGNNGSTAETTVGALADLSIVKSDDHDPVDTGHDIHYTLSVTNAGPSAAGSVTVTDTLPPEVTFSNAGGSGWTCGQASGIVTCTRPTLTVSTAPNITITVKAPTSAATLSNTASVSADTGDPNTGNNSDTETTTVTGSADLSIAKSGGPDPVNTGGTLTYTLAVANAGPDPAANLTVRDDLPSGLSFVSAGGTGWSCSESGSVVTCTRASLDVTTAPAITVTATVTATSGSISNTATVASATNDPVGGNNSDSESTAVTSLADVSITKTDNPDPVNAGASLTYTLVASNAGPSSASTTTVTDTLPAGVTFVSATGGSSGWSCNHASGVVTCTRGGIPIASSRTIILTVTAPSANGNIVNTVTVASATADPNPANNTDTTSTTVTGGTTLADLSIDKTDTPDPVNAGGTLTYTLSVTNGGPDTATGLSVTDTLPSGVGFVSATGTGWSCNQSSGTVTCTRTNLDPGAGPTITITVTAPAAGETLTNTATVTTTSIDANPANNSDTTTTTVAAAADLSIAKSDNHDPVDHGAAVAYTLAVTNAGPNAASSVTVTDTLPPSASFVSASGSGWTCGQSSGVVTCTRGSLSVANAPNITINITAPNSAGNLTDTATVSAATPDPNTANNSDTETTTVTGAANLSIAMTDAPDPVSAGGTLTYTLTVANVGPDLADELTVTDDLPGGVSFLSASGTGWTCSQSSGNLTCTRASLGVTTAPAITITTTVTATGGSISNTARVAAATNDPVSGNNSDSVTTTVSTAADVSITQSDSPDPVTAGENVTYTLLAANAGPSTATTITVTDTLPTGATFVSAAGTNWTCSHASGVVTCTRSNIPAEGIRSIVIIVKSPASSGIITNTATISAATVDPDPADNSDAETTTVTGGTTLADLSIVKTDASDPVAAGAPLSYILSVSNSGPEAASGISVTDPLPAGAGFVSATGSGWTCNQASGTVTCTRTTLSIGAAPAITITATAPAAAGPITNTATVATASADPNASNNTSSQDTTITALADLSIAGTDAPDPVLPGGPLTYTLNVSNAGPSAASAVSVTDPLPGGVIFLGASGSGWTCGLTSGTVTCTRATLAVGPAPPITINVTAPLAGTTLTNTATVGASTADPSSANNSDSEATTVSLAADVSIALADAPDPVNAGAALVYTVTVTNTGPDTASQLTVTDPLPAGVSFQSATGSGWTCGQASGTVTCTRTTLSVGAAPAITISVTAPGNAGSLSNTVSVTAVSADLNPLNNSDTEATTVNGVSDLSLTQSDAPDPVSSGGSVAYTLTVANAGPSPAASITVVDTLPPAAAFVSASGNGWSCNQAAGVVTCTRPSLAAATEAPTITVTVTAPGNGGTITNTASVTAAGFDPNTANNGDSETTTVASVADLSITKGDAPDPVSTHAALTYTLDVANAGPATASTVTVTDPLPAGTAFVSATGSGWACNQASGTVTCTRASLAVGAAPTITITVTAPSSGGLISNTASVTAAAVDPVPGNNSATAETTVIPVSDLSIVKSDGPDPVVAGAELTYTLAVSNAGPDTATSVSVTDTLPAGVGFQSASGNGWSCSQVASIVTCTRGSLATGGAPAITIIVTAPSTGGAIVNTATVGSFNRDPDSADNTSTTTTTVRVPADLSIVKTDGPDPVDASAPLTYTLAVTNAGPGPATAVQVTDTLPAGVAFVSAGGSGWSCSRSGSTVTCTRNNLAVGNAPAITIVVTTPNAGGPIDNTAAVSSTTPDTNAANNSDTETTTVRPPIPTANLSVAITDSPDPANSGSALTYTLNVANAGPSPAVAVTLTNTLPSGVLFGSVTGSGWTCNRTAGVVTCTRANLAVGSAPAVIITVTTPSIGTTLNDTASVSSTTLDPATGNNSDTESTLVTTVPQFADLSLTQTDAPDPVNAGAALAYTLNVRNAGPNPASDVTVTDTLPPGALFVSATGAGWTCDQVAGVVTCTRTPLGLGPAPPIKIALLAPLNGGSTTNDAHVASATSDANPANNAESESTVLIGLADLSIHESDTPNPVPTSQKVTSLLQVANAGPSNASSVSVTDTLPPGTTFVSAGGNGWSCANATGTVTCTRPTLPPGDAPPITLSVTAPPTGGTITNHSSVDGSELDIDMSDNQASRTTTVLTHDNVHDIAITKITPPAVVKLTAGSPGKTVRVTVQIQNRGGHQEVILDRVILSRLVTLSVQSLGSCPAPTAVVNSFKLAKKNKLNVLFDVTFDCANDPLPSGDGTHSDFLYVASAHREVIDGEADVHPEDDVCPRSVPPPFVVDPYPDQKIKDKGCGKKKPDKTFGAPVLTDIIVR